MLVPTGQLDTIRADIAALLAACATDGHADNQDAGSGSLPELAQAFDQLLDVFTRAESDLLTGDNTAPADITELGEFGLQLTESLAARVGSDNRQAVAALVLNVALWIEVHGGQIDILEPVVDALALYANASADPAELEALGEIIRRIIATVSPLLSQDLEKINQGRPWRVLLLNQSIVATRSHNIQHMERAFACLADALPEDAPGFFSEGMQQMDALNYPDHVREVMEKYHRKWNMDHSLH